MTTKDILASYRITKSQKKTAISLGVSEGVVRKCLITAGLHTSERIERIKELSAAGMPQKDIAEHLGVSTSCVNTNSPYEKGTYLSNNKSANALRIRKTREKQRKGAG